MKLTIGYFYPELLNLYGDDGNVQILKYRAEKRGIDVEIVSVDNNTKLNSNIVENINLIFMGGGPDSSQKDIYKDLIKNKGDFLKNYIEKDGVGLFICGAYQLLGNYYKTYDGKKIKGLGILDFYTKHFGKDKKRCVGNMVCSLNQKLIENTLFKRLNKIGDTLVGFENHGGRTYLSKDLDYFAKIITGYGNNLKDSSEGVLYKNTIGTYLHGPVLSKNPHLADYLIAKSLEVDDLEELDDRLIVSAHTASKKLNKC